MRRSYPQNRRKDEPPAPLHAMLVSLRISAKKSQLQVAREADMSHTYLSRLEKGKATHPSREVLIRLASALNTSPRDLFRATGYDLLDLPTYRAYLRTKYPHLPPTAVMELHDHFQWIHHKYGLADHLDKP